LLWTCTGRSQNIVLMLAQVGHPQDMDAGGHPDCGVCVAMDVHYLGTGGARAAAVLAADATFAYVQAERTASYPGYRPTGRVSSTCANSRRCARSWTI
jgi:hypothetical protein